MRRWLVALGLVPGTVLFVGLLAVAGVLATNAWATDIYFYVQSDGNDARSANTARNPNTPWATPGNAMVKASTLAGINGAGNTATVYLKAATYNVTGYLRNDPNLTIPLRVIGYKTTPGDNPPDPNDWPSIVTTSNDRGLYFNAAAPMGSQYWSYLDLRSDPNGCHGPLIEIDNRSFASDPNYVFSHVRLSQDPNFVDAAAHGLLYAYNWTPGEEEYYGGSVVLSDCIFDGGVNTARVDIYDANVTATRCYWHTTLATGLSLSVHGTVGALEVVDCNVAGGYGVRCDATLGNVTMHGNRYACTHQALVLSGAAPRGHIYDDVFVGNWSGVASYLVQLGSDSAAVTAATALHGVVFERCSLTLNDPNKESGAHAIRWGRFCDDNVMQFCTVLVPYGGAATYTAAMKCKDSTFRGNVFSGPYGVTVSDGASGNTFVDNTIYSNEPNRPAVIVTTNDPNDPNYAVGYNTWVGNIIDGGRGHYAIEYQRATATPHQLWQGNDLVPGTAGVARFNVTSTAYATLATLQAGWATEDPNGAFNDTASVSVDPGFSDPNAGDFSLLATSLLVAADPNHPPGAWHPTGGRITVPQHIRPGG